MITKVGLQNDFATALQDLLELDYDAIAAYDTAIEKIDNPHYKTRLQEFKSDHVKHTENISALLKGKGIKTSEGPSLKSVLTKGKVYLANLVGDKAILLAMISNEIDTNTAYERLNYHEDKWVEATVILTKGLDDERRHKAWLQAEYGKL